MTKRSFIFIISVLISILSFSASAQPEKSNFNRSRTFDVQHYKIQIRFDRKSKTVFGDTSVSLKPLSPNFSTVELDAAGLNFETVRFENENRLLKYKLTGEKVVIELEKAFAPQDVLTLRFSYSCKPKKGIYFVDEKKEGRKIVHSQQIWTQGEPEEAHHWFPSYDFPDDKATSELIISADPDETVIANGELIEKKVSAEAAVFHYRMPVPHSTYLTSFIVGKYSSTVDKYKNIPLGFYVYPGEESIIPLAFSDTKEMFRIFEEATGVPYPFNKYDQTIVDNFSFGGMENITATTYSDNDIFIARFPHLRGYTIDLVSHELAHSWFGNLVTCRNWAELWLNEGFATYLEAVYRGKMYGNAAYVAKIREDADLYLTGNAVNNTRHGLFNLSAGDVDKLFRFPNITYNKGSVVVHLLRETVGETNFWKAINIYLNRFKFGNVETSDLQKVFEEVSGMDLERFFKQWVYSVGHPRLEIDPVYDLKEKSLKIKITQTQKSDKLTPEVFVFPLEIFVQTTGGEKAETFKIDKKTQVVSIKLVEKPTGLFLDKNAKMPLFDSKVNDIKTE